MNKKKNLMFRSGGSVWKKCLKQIWSVSRTNLVCVQIDLVWDQKGLVCVNDTSVPAECRRFHSLAWRSVACRPSCAHGNPISFHRLRRALQSVAVLWKKNMSGYIGITVERYFGEKWIVQCYLWNSESTEKEIMSEQWLNSRHSRFAVVDFSWIRREWFGTHVKRLLLECLLHFGIHFMREYPANCSDFNSKC